VKFIDSIGQYTLLMKEALKRPERGRIYFRSLLDEIEKIGFGSIVIVLIISFFFGAVITLQTAYNMNNPMLPDYLVGLGTRESILLEFSSTILSLILAGKVGSNIASEIGTMRVSEQIDALEIMGINPSNYLILPKITAGLLSFPILSLISMVVGIIGGWFAGWATGEVPSSEYIYGIQYSFNSFYITYSLIKSVVFSLLITSVSSYFGFFVSGGALEVGRASTKAVVNSSLLILVFNYLLTNLLLT